MRPTVAASVSEWMIDVGGVLAAQRSADYEQPLPISDPFNRKDRKELKGEPRRSEFNH